MAGTWWTRVVVIVITLTWGVWMLAPTFLGESTQQMLEAQAAAASSAADSNAMDDDAAVPEGPWWLGWLRLFRCS